MTTVPGPKSKKLLSELSEVQSMASIQFFVDYKASRGNYIVDADGNKVSVLTRKINNKVQILFSG